MFRSVQLPGEVPGKLLLHSMPGRYEELGQTWEQIEAEGVQVIVSLVPIEEILVKSPSYAEALSSNHVPCPVEPFPIVDHHVPDDRAAFWSLAGSIAQRLNDGCLILVHCAGGVGRTGILATSVLLALGQSLGDATQAVSDAKAAPETDQQREFLLWCAAQSGGG